MATQQSCNSARCSATIAECCARVRPLNPASVKYVPRRFSQHRNSSALQNRRAKRRRCHSRHSRHSHHNHPARNAGAANASKADARIAAKSELNAVSVADVESKRPREARQMTERYHAE